MKTLLAAALVSVTVALGTPVSAGSSPRPDVTIHDLRGPFPDFEGNPEWLLDLTAQDPDGIITSVDIVVRGRALVHADTGACLFGTGGPGEPASMSIGLTFPESGRYTLQALATSYHDCTSNQHQESAPATKTFEVVVEAPSGP